MMKIKASLKKLVLNFNLFKKISSTDEYLGETNKRISKREVNLSPKTVDAFKPKARVY